MYIIHDIIFLLFTVFFWGFSNLILEFPDDEVSIDEHEITSEIRLIQTTEKCD